MSAAHAPGPGQSLEVIAAGALGRIQVTREEINTARDRQEQVAGVVRGEFSGSYTYTNGSVAHGDALDPLTDVDLGVVVHDPEGLYGPGKLGPGALQKRAAAAIKTHLRENYPNLRVELAGQKRSILIRFRETGREDFTADVIVAIDNVGRAGLFIPRHASWDRSDPEKHTELVLAALKKTDIAYARVVRLLKHWNRGKGTPPLCSWNIKALALDVITEPIDLIPGLLAWFIYAAAELDKGETADPARVAEKPIHLNVSRTEAVRVLRDALEHLQQAVDYEQHGYRVLAHDCLAKLFNDPEMLPFPDQTKVMAEEARRQTDSASRRARASTTTVSSRPAQPVRSWAP